MTTCGPPLAPFPFGVTVSVRRGITDRFGDKTMVDHHEIEGCAVTPRYSSEVNGDRASVIVGFSLYGPADPNPEILPQDEIVVPGPQPVRQRTYRVVGELADWRSPLTGWHAGFEAALERVS